MYQSIKLPSLVVKTVISKYHNIPRMLSNSKYEKISMEINSKLFNRIINSTYHLGPRYQNTRPGNHPKSSNDFKFSTKNIMFKKKPKVLYYTLGFILFGTVGTITYSEYDPNFRDWLEKTAPGMDKFIKIVHQKKNTYNANYQNYKNKLKYALISNTKNMFKKEPIVVVIDNKQEELTNEANEIEKCTYKPPFPVLTNMQRQNGSEVPYSERRIIYDNADIITIKDSERKSSGEVSCSNLPATHLKNLIDLETNIGKSAEIAICAYSDAIQVMRNFTRELYQLINIFFSMSDPELWTKVKEIGTEIHLILLKAETKKEAALENIERLSFFIQSPELDMPLSIKERVIKNISKITWDLDEAKNKYEKEAEVLSISQKFKKQVEETRAFFKKDLIMMFPKVITKDKDLKIREEEMWLLISFLYQSVLYYEKELIKAINVGSAKFAKISKDIESGKANLVDVMVEAGKESELRTLELELKNKEITFQSEIEKVGIEHLKREAKAQAEYLKDALALKEVETEQKLHSSLNDQLDEIRRSYRMQVADMIGRMKGFNVDKKKDNKEKQQQTQVFWSACQALLVALNAPANDKPWNQQLQPLKSEILNIVNTANKKDDLVNATVASIPKTAIDRGVYSKNALKERFMKIKKIANQFAQVPDDGAPGYFLFLSFIQSLFVFKHVKPISTDELTDESIDSTKLNTYDILQHANYWLDKDNFEMAIRYMKLLQGVPKSIAEDWIQEVILYIETEQAASILLAHATSTCKF
uniref:MICOS complex subunit MIC60 n=1 Tax=Clastoptera arizonana TaxID=38151 RepID=A0A1B6CLD5_9HEMI